MTDTKPELDLLDQQYEMLPVTLLRPHPFNPNEGDEDALAASVDETGFYGAVTVRPHPDEEGAYQILAGEHRWRLAVRRQAGKIPAIVLQDVDDVQAARILINDNEVTRRGKYNQDAMDKVIGSLGDAGGSALFDSVLAAAGAQLDEDEAAAAAAEAESYSDDSTEDDEYQQEWGILIMADSELEQQSLFETLAATYGAGKLRVVSV